MDVSYVFKKALQILKHSMLLVIAFWSLPNKIIKKTSPLGTFFATGRAHHKTHFQVYLSFPSNKAY